MTYPKFTKPTQMKKGGKKKKKSSGKPKPTNPSLWSRAKSMARSKFDVYPSAYANAWAAKWYKSKGGGWRGGKKKAAGGSEPKPLTTEEYSKIYEMLKQYFPKQEGVNQAEYGRQLNLVMRNVFADADSLKYTRNLLKNNKLDEALKNITSAPILQKALSGEEVGVLEIPGAVRGYIGSRTNPNSVIVQDALKAMGVKPEDAPGYIKEQIRQVGYDAMNRNPGVTGPEDQKREFDKELERNIGLFDFANRGEIYEYSLEAGGGPISAKPMARGGNPDPTPFEKAFAAAVAAGKKTFTFEGKEYTTDIQTQTPGGRIGEFQTFTGTPEQFQVIQEGQGPVPLPAAEIVEDFVPRDKGEQDAYDNLGVEGALRARKMMDRVREERDAFARDYGIPFLLTFANPIGAGSGPIMAGTRSTAPGILSRSYNLYPKNPRSLYGVQPMNIYEKMATNIGRYGTRDVATKPTFVNRAADFVTENFPSFLRSPKQPSSPYILPQADGGYISYQQGGSQEGDLMRIQNGGTHEQSPLGGVPMGEDADGRQVLVEEGETIRKGIEEDFVFSDRLKLTKQEAEEFGLDKKFVGQSFAKISEKIETRSRRRKDPIDQQTIDILLNRLEEAQETFKQRKLAEAKEMYGDPAAEEGPVAPSEGRSGPDEPPTQEEAIAINAMLQQAAMAGQGGMPPQGAPMGGPPPGMMPGPGAMPPGPGPTMMPHGGPPRPGEAVANPLIGMANAGIPPSQLDFDNADTATKERLAAMFPNTYKISADTPTLEDLRVAQGLDPTSGLPTFETLKPGRTKAITSNPPISQEQFDMLDPRVKAEYVEAFPGVYKISADTPTLQDLQNMQVTTKSHGGAYHNAQGQPVDKDGVLLPPEMFSSPGQRSVFQYPQGTNLDFASIGPGNNPQLNTEVLSTDSIINNPELNAALLSSADTDAISMGAATPMGQGLDSGTVTAAGDQGDDDGTPDPVPATNVDAADVAQVTAAQKANVVKVETVVDEKTGEKTIVRTYDDGSTQEFKIPEVDTPGGLTALQAAPIAANIMTSAMLPEKFDFSKYRLPLDDSIIEKRDISPELRDIERMVATGRGAISGRATSTAELLVGLANLTALGMAETGKIRNEQYTDYIAQLQNQQLRNLEISSRNATMQAEVDAANAGLEKERLSLINAAATEASKLADSLRQEGLSKYELEQMYLMYPYLATTQPQTKTSANP